MERKKMLNIFCLKSEVCSKSSETFRTAFSPRRKGKYNLHLKVNSKCLKTVSLAKLISIKER